jgi:hypothetical protein
MGLRAFLTNRRWLVTLAGTAGCWFLLDYAYYGNTISTPQIIGLISPHSSTMTTIAIQLVIFTVAAVPGYLLGIAGMDRIGHRRLQIIGFAVMGLCFAVIGLVPGLTTAVVPFLLVYGVSYFFTEFGPNMTTFVMPSELFPVTMRATGHGISAGVGKLGAIIGVFLFPLLSSSLGLRGTLLLTAGVSVLGLLLSLVLPEPAGRSLDEVSGGEVVFGAVPVQVPAELPSSGPVLVDSSGRRPGTTPDRGRCSRRGLIRSIVRNAVWGVGWKAVRCPGRAGQAGWQGHQGTLFRVPQPGPDPVELGLVVERVQPEQETEQQADPAVAGALHVRVFLHLGDPLAGPVDRHVRRDDDDPADRDREYGDGRLHDDLLVEVPGFAVDLVVPDQVVDAECDQRPDQPGQPDVPGLACTSCHAVPPNVECPPRRPRCSAPGPAGTTFRNCTISRC